MPSRQREKTQNVFTLERDFRTSQSSAGSIDYPEMLEQQIKLSLLDTAASCAGRVCGKFNWSCGQFDLQVGASRRLVSPSARHSEGGGERSLCRLHVWHILIIKFIDKDLQQSLGKFVVIGESGRRTRIHRPVLCVMMYPLDKTDFEDPDF